MKIYCYYIIYNHFLVNDYQEFVDFKSKNPEFFTEDEIEIFLNNLVSEGDEVSDGEFDENECIEVVDKTCLEYYTELKEYLSLFDEEFDEE